MQFRCPRRTVGTSIQLRWKKVIEHHRSKGLHAQDRNDHSQTTLQSLRATIARKGLQNPKVRLKNEKLKVQHVRKKKRQKSIYSFSTLYISQKYDESTC